MSLVLLLNPSRTINSIKSRTAANRSQLGYQFRREDFTSATNAEDNGSGFLRFGNSSPETNFPVGSQIYVFDDGNYANLGTVTSNTAVASRVDTDIPFNGVQVGSLRINNFTTRPFYRVEIQLKAEDGEIFADNIAYEPDPTGEVFVDVQGFLRPRTFFDRNENYQLSYRENWLGNTPGGYVGDEFIQAISANLTLYGRQGANMWKYLLKEASPDGTYGPMTATTDNGGNTRVWFSTGLGDFTTAFIIGRSYFFDFPNTYPDGFYRVLQVTLSGSNTRCTIELPFAGDVGNIGQGEVIIDNKGDSNRGRFLTAFASGASKVYRGWTNRIYYIVDLDCQSRNTSLSYRSTGYDINKENGVNLRQDGVNITQTRIGSSVIENDSDGLYKWMSSRMLVQSDTADGAEEHFSRLENECVNPVMIEYRNEKGGFDQWLFQFNQTLVESLETSLSWERRIERPWEEIQRTYERGTLERRQTIRVVAENISKQEYYGLAELFTSNEVYVWLNKDGSRKIGAVVRGNPPRVIRTKTRRQNLQVTLAFPNDFNFFQAVEYDLNQGLI